MNKEPEAGEYWYVTLERNDNIYEDKYIKLIKIRNNIKIYGQDSIIAYVNVNGCFKALQFVHDIKYSKFIWIKQWKPNWFWKILGY